MAKMRVYELAKELGVDSKYLLRKLKERVSSSSPPRRHSNVQWSGSCGSPWPATDRHVPTVALSATTPTPSSHGLIDPARLRVGDGPLANEQSVVLRPVLIGRVRSSTKQHGSSL